MNRKKKIKDLEKRIAALEVEVQEQLYKNADLTPATYNSYYSLAPNEIMLTPKIVTPSGSLPRRE